MKEKANISNELQKQIDNLKSHIDTLHIDSAFANKVRQCEGITCDRNDDEAILQEIEENAAQLKKHENEMESLINAAKNEKDKLEEMVADLQIELSYKSAPNSPFRCRGGQTTFDKQLLELQRDLNRHIRSLQELITILQSRLANVQSELDQTKIKHEYEQSENAGKIAHLDTMVEALQKENLQLKGQLEAARQESADEAVALLIKQLGEMQKLFEEMTRETCELREKLARSKDTLFANRIRKSFANTNDDEIAEMLDADGTLIKNVMLLFKPNATQQMITIWRKKLIQSINNLARNIDLMNGIRQMFDLASQENLPTIAKNMKGDENPSIKRSGELLEELLRKTNLKTEVDGILTMTLVLFTTFMLKPNYIKRSDDEYEYEEEDLPNDQESA
ncbi:hypothetical protein TRFO_03205 [Tritrichomonas foetus]|uniref:Uncharacterized protein n=1 Tax=Tritrichomonas foetus TaxID=1144522 RepID=A0A1J4KWR9_9EUKA|nr:hypothetical protein TRFO_03205 [Tritrichomonas foetus]|eukprot:OHT14156.1 hypothetical protein TRFO_03205 [Tritrichomonas foetus]